MSPLDLANHLGAHSEGAGGDAVTRFAVWAPNASAVSVVGDFNGWQIGKDPMQQHEGGIWECRIAGVGSGALYKYAVCDRWGNLLPFKADPVARQTELPPATASIVSGSDTFDWSDHDWMAGREQRQQQDAPIAIYEVHVGSWLDMPGDGSLWAGLGPRLIEYASRMGFTHIELLPIAEYPFGGSWGYQPLSLFAPSARYGTPDDFASFVNACHQAGLGVIVDWVPAHFPNDEHGLARFDGTALYEHAHPFQGHHPDWNTLIYNVGRDEVSAFLIASALFWLQHYHIDGLRVDAVASMLYLDYSRKQGQWIPNRHGGRENLESVDFLQRLNRTVHEHCPGAIMVAEESTAWPGVTASIDHHGLGFDYKWNMGWMHDTLAYMQKEPVYRRHHHNQMTFASVYAWTEHFILPLSHDEVVHGKGSLLGKMPGDDWQRFANLRAVLGFMWGHPGKKLLFMGGELASPTEWDHDGSVDWDLLLQAPHAGVQRLVRDLNFLYCATPALYASDSHSEAFGWAVQDDATQSVLAFWRRHEQQWALIVSNMTPIPRYDYRIGVPEAGLWKEALNTDADRYGGSNAGNLGAVGSQAVPAHGMANSISLTLPPLATLMLTLDGGVP